MHISQIVNVQYRKYHPQYITCTRGCVDYRFFCLQVQPGVSPRPTKMVTPLVPYGWPSPVPGAAVVAPSGVLRLPPPLLLHVGRWLHRPEGRLREPADGSVSTAHHSAGKLLTRVDQNEACHRSLTESQVCKTFLVPRRKNGALRFVPSHVSKKTQQFSLFTGIFCACLLNSPLPFN